MFQKMNKDNKAEAFYKTAAFLFMGGKNGQRKKNKKISKRYRDDSKRIRRTDWI